MTAAAALLALSVLGQTPNLQPTELRGASPAFQNMTMWIVSTVRNAGAADAGPFTVRLYYVDDPLFPTYDTVIGEYRVAGLAAGASLQSFTTITMPRLTGFAHAYGIVVDADGQVLESDEGDNRRLDDFFPSGGSNVDYVVDDCAVPALVRPGATQTVRFTVRNAGSARGGTRRFPVKIVTSSDDRIDGGDPVLDSFQLDRLDAGERVDLVRTVTLPSLPYGTTRWIGCWADFDTGSYPFDGEQLERNETNNIARTEVLFTDVDLRATALTAPPAGGPGLPLELSLVVDNAGGQAAPAFELRVDEGALTGAASPLLSLPRSGLGPGAQDAIGPLDLRLPANLGPEGTRRQLVLHVDPGDAVRETDETNNRLSREYVVRTRDLLVDALVPPVSASPGQLVVVLVSVRNRGVGAAPATTLAVHESATPAVGNDAAAATAAVPALAPGGVALVPVQLTVPPHGAASGTTRWFVARADAGELIAESHETNNLGSAAYRVETVDLVAAGITPPPVVGSGLVATIPFRVRNPSATDVPQVELALVASSDAIIDDTDPVLARDRVGPILAGDTLLGAFDDAVLAPLVGASGTTIHLGLRVDPDGLIFEVDETNNATSAPTLLAQRDLVVVGLELTPPSAPPGDPVTARVTVENRGVEAASAVRLALFDSADPVLDPSDPRLSSLELGAVAAGGSRTATIGFAVPPTAPRGVRSVFAVVDPDASVTEFDETNNAARAPLGVDGRIDLVAAALQGPVAIHPGQLASLVLTVRNDGDADAVDVEVEASLGLDAVIDPSDLVVGRATTARVARGASVPVTVPIRLPDQLPGSGPLGRSLYLGARVDPRQSVPETDETNNGLTRSATVTGGDLVAVALEVPAGVGTRQPIPLRWRARNDASVSVPATRLRVFRSDDASADELDDLLLEAPAPAMAARASATGTVSVQLPARVGPGDVGYFVVVLDAPGVLPELDESNNVAAGAYRVVNHPPVARALVASEIDEGRALALDGRGSTDPDGDPLRYHWRQVSGPPAAIVDPSAALTALAAPPVCGPTPMQVALEVCDLPALACATTTVAFTVRDLGNDPPSIVAVVRPGATVGEDVGVTLDASGTRDCNGDALSYRWVQTAGPPVALSGATSAAATFRSPRLLEGAELEFRVEVCDPSACASQVISVRVLDDVNEPPVARIAGGLTVLERTVGVLDASASSDPNGDRITSWRWGQLSGPRTTVTGTTTGRFVAPSVVATTTVGLALVVVDDRGGASPPALVEVIVVARADTDGDGLDDDEERDLGTDPLGADTDGDGLDDGQELAAALDPLDRDSDDDGVIDGDEASPFGDDDGDGAIGALDPDSDDDGLFDGTEQRVALPDVDTATAAGVFVPDADTSTGTDPLRADSDGDGLADGVEDANRNGRVDPGESDPNDPLDPPPSPDAGVLDGGEGDDVGATGDAGTPDPADAGARSDAAPGASDAGAPDAAPPGAPSEAEGCGCAATAPGLGVERDAGLLTPILALLLGLAVRRRRRR